MERERGGDQAGGQGMGRVCVNSKAIGACLVHNSDKGFRNCPGESSPRDIPSTTSFWKRGLHLISSRWFYRTSTNLKGHVPRKVRQNEIPGPVNVILFGIIGSEHHAVEENHLLI